MKNNCCGEPSLPSCSNELEILVRQLKREVEKLMTTTEARLLCQSKKIDETMVYIKNNLSNALRDLLDSMIESGELEELITSIITADFTQMQSDVENLKNDVENINSNIDTINSNIDTINSNIDNIENTINSLQEKQDTLIVFGDSWTAPTVNNSIWSNTLAFNLGLNLRNYAVDGAGFVYNGYGLIINQFNSFRDDINNKVVDSEKIKYVVVCGGINDFRHNVSYGDLANAIKLVFSNIKNLVPNAKLLFVANCQYPYQINQFTYWNKVKINLIGIDTLMLINKIPMTYFDSTYFHLTQEGQRLFLAQNVQSMLEGGEIISLNDERIVEDTDTGIKYTYVLTPLNDDTAQIYIEIRSTNTTDTFIRYTKPSGFIDLPYSSGFYNCAGVALNKSIGVMYQDPTVLELDRSTATSTYYIMYKNIRV